jgi:short subunit dehydrogenase-like uncharacterized protein
MASERSVDLVVFGATGFAGRLVAEYLAGHAPPGVRIGLAGRSRGRLNALRQELGPPASEWPVVVADSSDGQSMRSLAEETRVVVTTVGPYAHYGMPLLEACVAAGTHYADLSGELLFVRESVDRFHDEAGRRGTRIVHACGYDSIPPDLGVFMVHRRVEEDSAGELGDTTLVARLRGGVSGGTLASLAGQLDAARVDPAKQKILADPYALSPDRGREPSTPAGGDHSEARWPVWVRRRPGLGGWTSPFPTGSFDACVVRRSNALQGWAYGREFRYQEVMGWGESAMGALLAAASAGGQAGLVAGLTFPATRAVLDRVLPKPGSGPNETVRQRGHFRSEIHTTTTSGARYLGVVAGQGDPGYAATAVMLGESGLCLATDEDRLPDRAGVLTPATAMDAVLLDRLRAAGLTCAVERA